MNNQRRTGSRTAPSRRNSGSPTPTGRTSGSARRPATRTPPRTRPQQSPDLLDRAIAALGRVLARTGRSTGRAVGHVVGRGVGRVREIDPEHRRDGLGVALLLSAMVSAAGIWWGAGGPIGAGASLVLRYTIGRAAAVLPVALVGAGIALVATRTQPPSRPQATGGSLLLALGALGLVHLGSGSPNEPAQWPTGGGVLGFLAAAPLTAGLGSWIAVPVLVLLCLYAILLLTATPIRAVPHRVRRLLNAPDQQLTRDPAVVVIAPATHEPTQEPVTPSRVARPPRTTPAPTPIQKPVTPPRGERPVRPPAASVTGDVAAATPAEPAAHGVVEGEVGEQLRMTVQDTADGERSHRLPPADLLPAGPGAQDA